MIDPKDVRDADQPLDPAVLRVQQRLRTMMLWSRGIMLVGFAALFAVIFYKFYWTRQSGTPADALTSIPGQSPIATLPMPEGGHITDSRVEGNRLVVSIDSALAATVLVIDLETLQTLRRIDFKKGS